MESGIGNSTNALVKPSDFPTLNTKKLNSESLSLINQIIEENDPSKRKDLTYLFNDNQKKKNMIRANKMSELLDVITDQAMNRFSKRPDEVSNQELISSMKVVNDLIMSNQKQIIDAVDIATPPIQVINQTNEVNIGSEKHTDLNRESREKVKAAVLNILKSAGVNNPNTVDAEVVEEQKEQKNDN